MRKDRPRIHIDDGLESHGDGLLERPTIAACTTRKLATHRALPLCPHLQRRPDRRLNGTGNAGVNVGRLHLVERYTPPTPVSLVEACRVMQLCDVRARLIGHDAADEERMQADLLTMHDRELLNTPRLSHHRDR